MAPHSKKNMKEIGRGAEAVISLTKLGILKDRQEKKYRIKEIDSELRKTRTRKEAKVLNKLEGIAPKLIKTDFESKIEMEHIEGSLVKHIIDDKPLLAKEIGKLTGIMHDKNIVHGDLTTSNMILQNSESNKQNTEKIRFIDFGLSFESHKVEDKAVDLHLFIEAVESKHFRAKDEIWKNFIKGYNPKDKEEILKRLHIVETRGKNKQKY